MGSWRGLGLGANSPSPYPIILRERDKPGFEEHIAQIITSSIGGFHADVIGANINKWLVDPGMRGINRL